MKPENNKKNDIHDQRLRRVEAKVDSIEKQMVTDEKFEDFRSGIYSKIDYAIGMLERQDQERHFTNVAVKRLEKEIERIKKVLKIT